jgi:outer membrane murein-binding lipoprotein Lpp
MGCIDGHDYELIAQEVSDLKAKLATVTSRLAEVEKVNARLEAAALTTARALQEISRHWHAVYEAMRREEQRDEGGGTDW